MVGNSLRSDILPVLDLGGQAVYIPYANTWAHENDTGNAQQVHGYYELENLGQLPDLVNRLAADDGGVWTSRNNPTG
jgi:putative hydrolase of the HAD superfamily